MGNLKKRSKQTKRNYKGSYKKQTLTMTKKWIGRLLCFGCAWITWSYVLASFAAVHGNYTVCENLSRSVVQFVIATILGYMLKSYFETHSEEYNKLVKMKMEQDAGIDNMEVIDFEETEEEFIQEDC